MAFMRCCLVIEDTDFSNIPPCLKSSRLASLLQKIETLVQYRLAGYGWAQYNLIAGWSSLVARRVHIPKAGGSNPPPATFYFYI